MNKSSETNSYDELPYPSKPFYQTHPQRLATVATLFGMQPKQISNCKVLEIGCADGSNLIPMACEFPESQFVGVDLSIRQIKKAKKTVDALKIKNIDLRHCNILDIDDSFEKYDYIIVHGIYSWVPDNVQKHILKVCKHRLNEQGVAYISYNTYPGWRMRGMLRDMMLYHANNFEDISSKISQARALINFLSETVPAENNAYGTLLRDELELIKSWDDKYFRHDSLEEVNDPIYFYQFMEKAKTEGLQYLAETEISTMVANNFDTKVKETLDKIGNNIIQREQYMDFIRNRMFRQTLLCHKDISLTREIDIDKITVLYISSNCEIIDMEPDLKSNVKVNFKANNLNFSSECPYTKSALVHLANLWPEYISFHDLLKNIKKCIYSNSITITEGNQSSQDVKLLASRIFDLYTKGIINLSLYLPTVKRTISKKPTVRPIARLQAKYNDWTTNQLHQPIAVDIMNKHLLPLLDGKHDETMIKSHLLKLIKNGTLTLQLDGITLDNDDEIMQCLNTQLKRYLSNASKLALLMN